MNTVALCLLCHSCPQKYSEFLCAVFPVYFKTAVHLSPATTNAVLATTPLFLAPFSFVARYLGRHVGACGEATLLFGSGSLNCCSELGWSGPETAWLPVSGTAIPVHAL